MQSVALSSAIHVKCLKDLAGSGDRIIGMGKQSVLTLLGSPVPSDFPAMSVT